MASQRADARHNRSALVAAARTVFADSGTTAPLDEVAAAASVGRGTLYRHFPDRLALVAAVYEEALDRYESFAERRHDAADIALRLIDHMTAHQHEMGGLWPLLRSAPDGHARTRDLTERTRRLFERHVATSHDAGALDPSVTAEDMLLILAMMEGVIASLEPAQVEPARRRVLALLDPVVRSGAIADTHRRRPPPRRATPPATSSPSRQRG